MPQEYIQERIVLVQLVPHGRVHERIAKQIVDISMPQIMEDIVLLVQLVPYGHAHECVPHEFTHES